MSTPDQPMLAEPLRIFLIEHAPLPVRGSALNIDTLLPSGESMSLQFSGGRIVRTYINGSKVKEQPFTLFYRGEITHDNDVKSAMLGVLDGIGSWMEENPMPYLGPWLNVNAFEQVQLANVISQDDKHIIYQAGYMLGYTTKK